MLSFRQTLRFAPPLVLIAFMLAARACAPSTPATNLPVVAPTVAGSQGAVADIASVYAAPAFEVAMTKDIVYAQGLSHETWGSESAEAMDLLLDVYEPVRFDDAVMPAIVMIHGGGFNGGSKRTGWISEWAPWFAARGWVVYSIDYRVSGDYGTLPSSYPELPAELTEAQIDQAHALYPACRDAKAAIRWISATADDYSVSTDHIAVICGSAGSVLAVGLGGKRSGRLHGRDLARRRSESVDHEP